MKAFGDDRSVISMGAFSIENGTRHIAMHGSLSIGRDRRSLKNVQTLLTILKGIEAELGTEVDLPDEGEPQTTHVETVANPFSKTE